MMTNEDFWLSVLAGIPSGLVTGLISGWMVSKYFTNRDKKLAKQREFENDKQILNRHIESLRLEVDILIRCIEENKSYDVDEFKRIDQRGPMTPSFGYGLTDNSYILLKETKNVQKEMDLLYLRKIRNELSRARLGVLSMKLNN
jgi:hypothetical protein